MKHAGIRRGISVLSAAAMLLTGVPSAGIQTAAAATTDISDTMTWGTLKIGGGGFVSGIVTGKKVMYARTDVGGAYKYNYTTDSWEQLFGFMNEQERGYLSVDAMAIDPSDDNTVYFLCGCAYFSDAGTRIYKTTDGGKSFTYTDVTDMIQVHGNGNGRQTGESIAVDPDDPNTIYCGGDVTAGDSCLIKSTDGGKTWTAVKSYDALGLYKSTVLWPTWTEHEARCLADGEYNTQNGVSSIYIYDGKVYVATSTTGKNSVVVANVSDDKFTDLSSVLDSSNYPARITGDGNGNLYFAYQGTVIVGNGGAAGGIYKYDTKTGTAKNVSPVDGGFSEAHVDINNPSHLIASTCGLWYSQMWQEWSDDHGPAWGDRFFRSEDGGETWTEITPGNKAYWGGPMLANYLDDGGYAWIRDKAIHWVGSIVIDPMNSDRIHITSGNGVFSCDDTWSECPTLYFHPDGIEEVVALDFASSADGLNVSAIGDYDGFVHTSVSEIPAQHQPNMGSTVAIAICPQNTDVWVRIAEGDNNVAPGFYTTDRGKTWTKMDIAKGGKAAITEISSGKYRVFVTKKAGVAYSDDWGETWNDISLSGLYYDMRPGILPDPEDPSIVWAYGYSQAANQWDTTPTEYKLYKSTDGGKTFSSPISVCTYDYCDAATRIAYLGGGSIALAGGWYGLYTVTDGGTPVKTDVFYCKTLGYGAPEKAGGINTLYMYGKPTENDAEGVYRSTDAGKTWVCINTDHLYGGTGNGNFLVGDMSEFGKVYMSTVGCGIVYGALSGSTGPSTGSGDDTIVWGDADCDGSCEMKDAVVLAKAVANVGSLSMQGKLNCDVYADGKTDSFDLGIVLQLLAGSAHQKDMPIYP